MPALSDPENPGGYHYLSVFPQLGPAGRVSSSRCRARSPAQCDLDRPPWAFGIQHGPQTCEPQSGALPRGPWGMDWSVAMVGCREASALSPDRLRHPALIRERSNAMCDYSLSAMKSRPAKVGDKLESHFFPSGTR